MAVLTNNYNVQVLLLAFQFKGEHKEGGWPPSPCYLCVLATPPPWSFYWGGGSGKFLVISTPSS